MRSAAIWQYLRYVPPASQPERDGRLKVVHNALFECLTLHNALVVLYTKVGKSVLMWFFSIFSVQAKANNVESNILSADQEAASSISVTPFPSSRTQGDGLDVDYLDDAPLLSVQVKKRLPLPQASETENTLSDVNSAIVDLNIFTYRELSKRILHCLTAPTPL